MKSYLFLENIKLSVLVGFIAITCNVLFAFAMVFAKMEAAKRPPIDSNNLLGYVFLAVIVAPFLEELMFRLPIIPNRTYCIISVVVVLIAAIKGYTKSTDNNGYIIFILWAILILLYNYASNLLKFDLKIVLIFFSIISSLIFAYVHIYNFTIDSRTNLFLTLFPMFVVGLLLSYVRIKAGIGWSVFTHSLINFFPGGLALLLKYFKFV